MGTYLEHIKYFWLKDAEVIFGSAETRIYFYLLDQINTMRGWCATPQLIRNNRKTEADLGMSINTIKQARAKLIKAGLLDCHLNEENNRQTVWTILMPETVIHKMSITDEFADELVDDLDVTRQNMTESLTGADEKHVRHHVKISSNVDVKSDDIYKSIDKIIEKKINKRKPLVGVKEKAHVAHTDFLLFLEWVKNNAKYCYSNMQLPTEDDYKSMKDEWGEENMKELILALENNNLWRENSKLLGFTMRRGLQKDDKSGNLKYPKPMPVVKKEEELKPVVTNEDGGKANYIAILRRDAAKGDERAIRLLQEMEVV